MPDPMLPAAAAQTPPPAHEAVQAAAGVLKNGIAHLEAVPKDVEALPLLQHMAEVLPAADLIFGGGMLIAIMLVHATGVRRVTSHVARRSVAIMERPTGWRADLLMASTVYWLLSLHLLEMFLWASALVYSGLVPDWRVAGFFAGNTYTTVGYGDFVLPQKWEMLAPIIAISGLFTFGWSGSVLVDLVGRCQRIKDAAVQRQAS